MIPHFSHVRFLFCVIAVMFMLCCCAVVVSSAYVLSYFGGNAESFPFDCAVVFGAAVHGRETAGPGITRRVSTAAALYRDRYIRTIYLTGGKGDALKASEAMVMRKVALLEGVAPEDVRVEENARSTWENLAYSREITQGCTDVLAISDPRGDAGVGTTGTLSGFTASNTSFRGKERAEGGGGHSVLSWSEIL